MADDDTNKDEGPDPWDGLESDAAANLDEGFSFSFEEASLDAGLSPSEGQPTDTPQADPFADAEPTATPSAEDDDAMATSWLDAEPEEPSPEQPFSVFSPDEPAEGADHGELVAAERSSIEIGTGESGVLSPSGIEEFEAAGEATPPAGDADDADAQPSDMLGFGAAAAVAAAAAAGVPAARPRAKAKPRKKGVLGQMVGVVLGGAMAIPITLAILVWGFQKDPFKVTKHVPESLAFLLPAKFQPGRVVGGPDLAGGPSLDDLPPVDPVAADASAMPDGLDGGSDENPAADGPTLDGEPAADLATLVPAEPPAPAQPGLDDLLSEPATPTPPAPPEPEPLDVSGLEAAVADALTALDSVKDAADADPGRKSRLVDWYKRMARVAEELAMLERAAADTGRPLTAIPPTVVELHEVILARPDLLDELARLSRNWLAYAKRGGDGVVMPARFAGARRVGPYWCARVSIAEAAGGTRDLAVISRSEPSALPGDLILVTGLAMDGDVVWASDMRSPGSAPGAQPSEPDPFAAP